MLVWVLLRVLISQRLDFFQERKPKNSLPSFKEASFLLSEFYQKEDSLGLWGRDEQETWKGVVAEKCLSPAESK